MGPTGHACHVFSDPVTLHEMLTAYVGGGLWAGDAVVLIATQARLRVIEASARQTGLDLAHFRGDDRLIALSAEATLSRFMVDGWPDAGLFEASVGEIVARARRGGRSVRAYGEMVAVLWERGNFAGAIRLEQLWNRLIERDGFRLLCAYEKRLFHTADAQSRREIRDLHSDFAS